MLRGLVLLAAAAVAPAAGAWEIVPTEGQSVEQMERDQAECTAMAREATGTSEGSLRISEVLIGTDEPIEAAAGDGRTGGRAGLFGGLHHGEPEPVEAPEPRQAAEATRSESDLERAYAACLRARGYSVKRLP
ncbi:MAG: hypothetical protein PVF91_08590 [Chromatiales bacterium]